MNDSFESFDSDDLSSWKFERLIAGQQADVVIDGWHLMYMTGAGTFVRVYRCKNLSTGAIKAIKVLRNRYSIDSTMSDQILDSVKLAKSLHHPNIVPTHGAAIFRGRTYMVMDFVEGQSLKHYIRSHGKLKPHKALEIMRDIMAGLDHAFDAKVLHRNLKLSKVFILPIGQARIADFGLVLERSGDGLPIDSDQKVEDSFVGATDYVGLERATNVEPNDPQSDIYFAGCILYHMLTGKPAAFRCP